MYFRFECETMFQSTRPRGARPHWNDLPWIITGVSIHAPAWGATRPYPCPGRSRTRFNPRARVGRDLESPPVEAEPAVSIHAPAWGATIAKPRIVTGGKGFNPRARVGRDSAKNVSSLLMYLFQSTRPRGARHRFGDIPPCPVKFQSTRPRGARRHQQFQSFRLGSVSIHAPAWGATPATSETSLQVRRFQSTRPRGARQGKRRRALRQAGFNPRARVGRDIATGRARHTLQSFNPRARVGRDCGPRTRRSVHTVFQSTRPRGARPGCRVPHDCSDLLPVQAHRARFSLA